MSDLATEILERLETVMESWQAGDLDSEEALELITGIVDEL